MKQNHFKIIIEKISPILIILFLILIIKFKLREKINKEIIKMNNRFLIIFLFSFIFVLIWFLKFPLYRFGQSFLIIFFTSLILIPKIKILKIKINCFQIKYSFIIVAVIALMGKILLESMI